MRLQFIPLIGFLIGAWPGLVQAAETRTFDVSLRGENIGSATLSVDESHDRVTTYTHHSELAASRGSEAKGQRILHEEVRVRGGVFLSAWAVRVQGEVKTAVSATWVPSESVVVVRRGRDVERVPTPEPSGVETLFDAPRRLVESGAAGSKRPVFDLPEGKVGWVVLESPRGSDGWAETRELGVRVRSRWAPGSRLPDALELPDVGLSYQAKGIELANTAARNAELTGVSVTAEGTLAQGGEVRLEPADAWAGLPCAGQTVVLTSSGNVCGTAEPRRNKRNTRPGPEARRLASRVRGASTLERAAALAALVDRSLGDLPVGAGLWEADAESALVRRAGDCNEAAAVFMDVAAALHLEARRRTGLVQDPDEPRVLYPHAWVEVHDGRNWIRVDPSRGEAPAKGVYIDLGPGDSTPARLRGVAASLRGASVKAVGAPPPGTVAP